MDGVCWSKSPNKPYPKKKTTKSLSFLAKEEITKVLSKNSDKNCICNSSGGSFLLLDTQWCKSEMPSIVEQSIPEPVLMVG